MITDWRALCVELLEWLDLYNNYSNTDIGIEEYGKSLSMAERARAALAEPEPEPEGPTDEEIMELMPQQMRDDLAAAARALAGFDPDNIKAASVFRIILNRHSVDLARAALARWGTPNLTETRSSLKDAWAAHQPAIEAAAKAGMDACRADEPAVPDGREPASVAAEVSATDLLERQAVGLAARPLMEQVVALGDCISEQTVGQVRALADRAAAWLAENPPGQPIAIEPRGCPTPGACSCVTQRQSAPESAGEVAELVAALRNDAINCTCSTLTSGDLRRAADLLEQRQAAPMAGWQPIDTAPKDGTEILASDYDAIEIVSWVEDREWKTWYWTGRDGQVMHPAWWQPLLDHPPIPTTEAQP